jgi:predicted dehydrogenase
LQHEGGPFARAAIEKLEVKLLISGSDSLGLGIEKACKYDRSAWRQRLHGFLHRARAGCHLLVEKPLSHDLQGIEELCTVVEQNKLVGLVAYQMRFHPCLQYAHACLREKRLGKIIAVRAAVGEYLPAWHTYEDYRQMYASRKDLGGGVVITQIHEIDYLYWFFGLPKRIFALGGHLSSLEIDVEDTASILMECNGIPVHLQQDYVQRPPSRNLEIIGNDGKLLVDLRAPAVQLFDPKGNTLETKTFDTFERNQLFVDELKHFLAAVEGREPPLVSLRDGVQSLRIALAAKESMVTGRVISLS